MYNSRTWLGSVEPGKVASEISDSGKRIMQCRFPLILLCLAAVWPAGLTIGAQADSPAKPNIILIIADDLGYGELGCYGQKRIRTPNVDRLAAEGIRFTQHYAGSPVCAPSRCTLMTGMHTGHAEIRSNRELDPEGQYPLSAGAVTLAEVLKAGGYATGAFGKWGLGPPGSEGDPNKQGFDLFYGYNCQRHAHNYYPTYLWRNDRKVPLKNRDFSAHQRLPQDKDPNDPAAYKPYAGAEYAPDLTVREGLRFLRENKDRPFLLYVPLTIPHMALQVPEDSLKEYEGALPDEPYLGEDGYLPQRTPHAAYAAMVSRFDRYVGEIMAALKELNLDEKTIVFFTSDNGPAHKGGKDSAFFHSAGPLRGLKGSVYEGGIRVPLVARWPGRIKPGSISDYVCAFWDILPTICEITGMPVPKGIDGLSFAPALTGAPGQKEHGYLYWEYLPGGGQQAVRMGDYKGVRQKMVSGNMDIALYNLRDDIGEQHDLSADHADIVARLRRIMREAHTPCETFPFRPLDEKGSSPD